MDYNLDSEIPKQSHLGLYAMIGVLITSVSLTSYTYMTNDFVPKGELKFKYVEKDKITFDSLPIELQNRYISKKDIEKENSYLKQEILDLKKEIIDNNKTVEKIVYKDKIIYKENNNTIEKIVYKNRKIDKTKYNRYSCTNMVNGGISPSKKCEKELYKFLDENNNSSLIEIININDNKEISFFKKLKNDKNYNKAQVLRIANYTQLGLSQKRVIEGSWMINKYLNNDDLRVQTVNYSIDSKNGKSGFVVKAYK